MQAEIILQQSASDELLTRKRERLVAVRVSLAECTAALDSMRSELKMFEDRYFREAGVLYAELDLLEACIAEREVDLYDSSTARERAKEAKQRAEQSCKAASAFLPERASWCCEKNMECHAVTMTRNTLGGHL